MFKIYLATVGYEGDDKVDITATEDIGVFSPPLELVMQHRNGLINDRHFMKQTMKHLCESFKDHREQWAEIAAKPQVTFTCSCEECSPVCHKRIVTKLFVEIFGAEYMGQR